MQLRSGEDTCERGEEGREGSRREGRDRGGKGGIEKGGGEERMNILKKKEFSHHNRSL